MAVCANPACGAHRHAFTLMTLLDAATLFAAMTVLALTPSVSVLAVTARAASQGLRHGVLTTAGIVLADLCLILLAVFGLAVLVSALGPWFGLLKALGGAYLLAMAVAVWRSAGPPGTDAARVPASERSSFLAGFLITLADQKALLFYLGFLPAFVDLHALSAADVGVLTAIAALSVGGVKLAYAWLAAQAGRLVGARLGGPLNRLAAAVMAAVGLFLIGTALLDANPAGVFLPSTESSP